MPVWLAVDALPAREAINDSASPNAVATVSLDCPADVDTMDRQGNDVGRSYRSEIFFTSDEQRLVAEETIRDVDASGLWPGPVCGESHGLDTPQERFF